MRGGSVQQFLRADSSDADKRAVVIVPFVAAIVDDLVHAFDVEPALRSDLVASGCQMYETRLADSLVASAELGRMRQERADAQSSHVFAVLRASVHRLVSRAYRLPPSPSDDFALKQRAWQSNPARADAVKLFLLRQMSSPMCSSSTSQPSAWRISSGILSILCVNKLAADMNKTYSQDAIGSTSSGAAAPAAQLAESSAATAAVNEQVLAATSGSERKQDRGGASALFRPVRSIAPQPQRNAPKRVQAQTQQQLQQQGTHLASGNSTKPPVAGYMEVSATINAGAETVQNDRYDSSTPTVSRIVCGLDRCGGDAVIDMRTGQGRCLLCGNTNVQETRVFAVHSTLKAMQSIVNVDLQTICLGARPPPRPPG